MTAPAYHLEFTEEMKGWFAFGETEYQKGRNRGRDLGWSVMFHLTIATEDTYRFIADPDHLATAEGWVRCDALGGKLPVTRGRFNLFVDKGELDGAPLRHMLYRLWFFDGVGNPLTLSGFKHIRHNDVAAVWPETSTLYIRVLQGHVEAEGDAAAPLVGSGVIYILPRDFARQCTTFRVRGPALIGRMRAFVAFGTLFMGELWKVFRPWRRRQTLAP